MEPTWWITVTDVSKENIILEETKVDRRRLIGLVDRFTETGDNVIIEIGLD